MSEGDDLDGIGYADAMTELEDILEHLEGDDLDVDALASRVERASALIDVCRARIHKARVQVESVVAKMETAESAPDDEPQSEAEDLRLLDDS